MHPCAQLQPSRRYFPGRRHAVTHIQTKLHAIGDCSAAARGYNWRLGPKGWTVFTSCAFPITTVFKVETELRIKLSRVVYLVSTAKGYIQLDNAGWTHHSSPKTEDKTRERRYLVGF